MKPQLISFKLCPFVQRSVIVLREKGIEFDVSYIELANPPAWFTAISPLGKVPLLRVGDAVLFESSVIMEYLDEITPPSLHPADPLHKAQNRAWFEFASNLFGSQYLLSKAKDENEFQLHAERLRSDLARLESEVRGPFFNGPQFNLVDAAFAPFFMREKLLDGWHPMGLMKGLKKLQHWSETLLARPSVQQSVTDDFAVSLRAFVAQGDGHAAKLFRE